MKRIILCLLALVISLSVTLTAFAQSSGSSSNSGWESEVVCLDDSHDFSSPTITKKATKTVEGNLEYKCKSCGFVENKTIYCPTKITVSTSTYTYDGKAKNPSITIKDSKGNTLKEDKDYTLTAPQGRKEVGTYSYKITFIGKYSGTATKSFEIKPATDTTTTIIATSEKATAQGKVENDKTSETTKKNETTKKIESTNQEEIATELVENADVMQDGAVLKTDNSKEEKNNNFGFTIIIAVVAICAVAFAVLFFVKRKKTK